MKRKLSPSPHFSKISQIIFLLGVFVVLGLNVPKLVREIQIIRQYRTNRFVGLRFAGLQPILKDKEYIGYYTDKDLTIQAHNELFSQAQYILAPTVLDLNNLDHPLVLFDCLSEQTAWKKIKELKAVPLKRNKFGLILAVQPEKL